MLLASGGCADDRPPAAPAARSEGLRPFADCADFAAQMRTLAAAEGERMVRRLHVDVRAPYGYQDGLGGPMDLQKEPVPADLYPARPAGASDPGAQPPEAGTALPDKVAVLGTRVLTLAHQGPFLRLVDVAGGVPRLAARLRLPYRGSELLPLDERRVLVISSFEAAWSDLPSPWRTPQTVLMLVDLRDPSHPVLTRTQRITGHYVSARLRHGMLRLVVDSPIRPPGLPADPYGSRKRDLERAREAAGRAGPEDLLPMRQIADGEGRPVSAAPLLRCSDVLTSGAPADGGILSVLTVDTRAGVDGFDRAQGVGVLGDGELVHAAGGRVYVAAVDGADGPAPDTRIHAFGATGRGRGAYLSTVRLAGRLLGDGGLSVRKGFLRAAAHAPNGAVVRVLDERAGRLTVVGELRLAPVPVATMRPVRWFGRFAILTGGQLVDLADPRRPVAVGTWNVGDYQAMHRLGGGRWLVVGDFSPERGLRAVLLDASGPGSPRRLDELVLGSGSAGASRGPEGLTYLPESGLAVTPTVLMEPPVAGSPIRKKRVMHYVALGISVSADGTLRRAGRVLRGTDIHRVVRAGMYLVVVAGSSQTVVDPDGMRVLGTLRTVG